MNNALKLVEVAPRDGLQNEKTFIKTDLKHQFVLDLIAAGFQHIEVTSFVHPKAVPQMSDAKILFEKVKTLKSKVDLICLVPNEKGLENANQTGVNSMAFFTSTSETFNRKNVNMSLKESREQISEMVQSIDLNKVRTRGYVSTVFGCPYEKETSIDILLETIDFLLKLGIHEIPLGDTIGVATPAQVEKIVKRVDKEFGLDKIAMHFHDTRGFGCLNSYIAYQLGIRTFDSSASGLGGCPYAKGATGNTASEELVRMFEGMGISTGVDIKKLIASTEPILKTLNTVSTSKFQNAFIKNGY
jgi:hydroxymethylglutaryl-CoA lyase